jgi:Spy/CpxP family protein refolding chaperone
MNFKLNIPWTHVIVALALGFFLGTNYAEWSGHEMFRRHCAGGDMKTFMLNRLNKKLHLSPDQKNQVAAVLEKNHPAMTALHEQFRPKFQALREATRTEIRQLLTPSQQKKFDELSAKWDKRWAGRFPGHLPPGEGPKN